MAGKVSNNKITKKKFKELLPESSCSYTQLSKLLGVHRYTLRDWLSKHSDMQQLFEKQKEFMIGESEDVLFEHIVNERDSKTAQWYLKVMTDKYNETTKVEHSGEVSFNINISDAKNKKKDE